jgi:hypothetical protein
MYAKGAPYPVHSVTDRVVGLAEFIDTLPAHL